MFHLCQYYTRPHLRDHPWPSIVFVFTSRHQGWYQFYVSWIQESGVSLKQDYSHCFQPNVVQILTEFSENLHKYKLMCNSIHYCCVNIRSWAHRDKQLVVLILQLGASKPLQEKRALWDDVIKSAPVKPQIAENHVENLREIWHLCFFHVLMSGMLQSN